MIKIYHPNDCQKKNSIQKTLLKKDFEAKAIYKK